MKKILVIGGSGFLGTNLVQTIQSCFPTNDIIILDKNKPQLHVSKFIQHDLLSNKSYEILTQLLDDNITDVIYLASNIGINLFNSTQALDASMENSYMLNTFINVLRSYQRKTLSVTWFSTSEIYGSSNTFSNVQFTNSNARSLYSQIKYFGETALIELKKLNYIKNYHIIRPFNPSGKYQKQGVVYDMYKSAINSNIITYKNNTTRTITDVQSITQVYLNDILSDTDTCEDYYIDHIKSYQCSLELKILAQLIASYIKEKYNITVDIQCDNTDSFVQFRHTNKLSTFNQAKNYIYNILNQF